MTIPKTTSNIVDNNINKECQENETQTIKMAETSKTTMPIPLLDDFDTWGEYEECVDLWQMTTMVDKKEQGAILGMTIPVNSTKWGDNLRKGLFQVVKPKTLGGDEKGVLLILVYLREKLAPTDACLKLELYNKIKDDNYTTGPNKRNIAGFSNF